MQPEEAFVAFPTWYLINQPPLAKIIVYLLHQNQLQCQWTSDLALLAQNM